MSKNILLIGFMGSGKSTVSNALAPLLDYSILETDTLIEALEGCSISDLFKTKGEAYFREQERALLPQLKERKSTIISTGGGFPLVDGISSQLKTLGYVVYLEASIDCIYQRLKGDNSRPLYKESVLDLGFQSPPHPFKTLYHQRCPEYETLSDLRLLTDDLSPEEIAKTIVTRYTEYRKRI